MHFVVNLYLILGTFFCNFQKRASGLCIQIRDPKSFSYSDPEIQIFQNQQTDPSENRLSLQAVMNKNNGNPPIFVRKIREYLCDTDIKLYRYRPPLRHHLIYFELYLFFFLQSLQLSLYLYKTKYSKNPVKFSKNSVNILGMSGADD